MLGSLVDEETRRLFESSQRGKEGNGAVCVGWAALAEIHTCYAGDVDGADEVDVEDLCGWCLYFPW